MSRPLISLSKMAIMAITNRIWMILPKLYTKNPRAHRIISITAMVYNRFDMVVYLMG